MAKKKKLPKKPKASSSLNVWQNYEKRRKEIESYNKKLEADAKKKELLIRKYRS